MLAEKAFSAESFHIDGNSVPRFNGCNSTTDLINNTHHFVTYRNSWDRLRNRSVLNMQITGTDAGKGHPDDSITIILKHWFWFFQQRKYARFRICVGQHGGSLLYL